MRDREDYDETPSVHPGSPAVAGYERLQVWGPPKPEDIYDKFSITKNAEGGLDVRKATVNESIHGDEMNLTWDDLRTRRDKMLDQSDSNLPADAPQSLVDEWTAYRAALRKCLPHYLQLMLILLLICSQHNHLQRPSMLLLKLLLKNDIIYNDVSEF